MSSFELMELLEFMPERGAFKTAARGGEFSEEEKVWRHIASEIGLLRATMHAVHGGERYSPKLFPTLEEIREHQESAESAEEIREAVFAFATRSIPKFEGDEP